MKTIRPDNLLFLFILMMLSFNSFAGIILTEIDFRQTNPLTTDWRKTIDVNKDGVADFTFSGNFMFHDLLLEQEENTSLCYGANPDLLHFFQRGDSINGSMDFMAGNFLLVHMDSLHMPSNTVTYIGFNLVDVLNDKIYYGWISLKLDIFHKIFYLYEAAMNDVEGKSIAAGQTGVAIPENPMNQISILMNKTGISFGNLPAGFHGRALLYDLSGKLIADAEISIQNPTLAILPREAVGLLTLSSGKDRLMRKIFLGN